MPSPQLGRVAAVPESPRACALFGRRSPATTAASHQVSQCGGPLSNQSDAVVRAAECAGLRGGPSMPRQRMWQLE
jgi:hypothetical protein